MKGWLYLVVMFFPWMGCSDDPDPKNGGAVCGNGVVEAGEACDDGNLIDGDGCSSACQLEHPQVVLNEVVAGDPFGGPDWVEILNMGATAIDLRGWSIGDEKPEHLLYFSDLGIHSLEVDEYLVVPLPAWVAWGFGRQDSAVLYDAGGVVVDQTMWDGDASDGRSWGRLPDGVGGWESLLPTPGAANAGSASCGNGRLDPGELCDGPHFGEASCASFGFAGGDLQCLGCVLLSGSGCRTFESAVVVNEVSSKEELIELYNAGDSAVSLLGYRLSDRIEGPSGRDLVLPAVELAPGGYHVVDLNERASFRLAAEEQVLLKDPGGQVVDYVQWPLGHADPSYCRLPNGSGTFSRCAAASFGEANP